MKNLLIIVLICTLFSCNRKSQTQKSETHEVSNQSKTLDSLNRVIKTWSDSYEELLKTTNSTGVVFEKMPCDSGKIGGAGMPHIIIKPDGTKEFSGPIKSYKDDASKYQRTIFSMRGTIDSLNQIIKKDTSHHEASTKTLIRTVKVVTFPWWLIVGGLIFLALWINERFNLFKIPFLTKK
jgi:hypothetical protein